MWTKALPPWMRGRLPKSLKNGSEWLFSHLWQWLEKLREEAFLPSCSEEVLNAYGEERGFSRFPKEPEDLYRKRLSRAEIHNTASLGGFSALLLSFFGRPAEIIERPAGKAFDVVQVKLASSDLGEVSQELLEKIFLHHGRAFRRYEILLQEEQKLFMATEKKAVYKFYEKIGGQ